MAKELSEIRQFVDELTENRDEAEVPTDLTQQLAYLVDLQKQYKFPILEEVKMSILLYPYSSEDFVVICEKLVWMGNFFTELSFSDSLEGILRVRKEILKRESLCENLSKLKEGPLSFTDLKAILSGLVRVIIEFEQRDSFENMVPVLSRLLEILSVSLTEGLSEGDLRLLRFIFGGLR